MINILLIESIFYHDKNFLYGSFKIKSRIVLCGFWPIFYSILFCCLIKNLFWSEENED